MHLHHSLLLLHAGRWAGYVGQGLSRALSMLGRPRPWRAGPEGGKGRQPGIRSVQTQQLRGSPGLGCTRFPTARSTRSLGSPACASASASASGSSLPEKWGRTGSGCHGGYSPGDRGVSAALSSREASQPSSGWVSSAQLSRGSEARASLAGGERKPSVHLGVSVWKVPTGVVPPEDSPPRDRSSSPWASSMSLSLLSLRVSCSMVRKIMPTSLRARPGEGWPGSLGSALPVCGWGWPGGAPKGSVLESTGPAGMLT